MPSMARIPINIADHVGRTPMIELTRLAPEGVRLFGKLESFNPGGSVKDRIGVAMIEAAEADGLIEPGRTTIVEATSGNTGIALAFVCAAKGYDLVLTLPQGMSREREALLRLYGARVEITESLGGMNEAVQAARDMARARRRLPARPVLQPREPRGAPPHDRAGAVGRARRRHRRPRLRRRDRRHDHRRGGGAEGAQPEAARRRRRAGDLGGAVRPRARPAQDPGHRRRLRPAGAQPRDHRRGHRGRRRGRARHGARRRRARRACSSASRAARRCGGRSRSAGGRSRAASGSRSCCRTPASATSRRRSSRRK